MFLFKNLHLSPRPPSRIEQVGARTKLRLADLKLMLPENTWCQNAGKMSSVVRLPILIWCQDAPSKQGWIWNMGGSSKQAQNRILTAAGGSC